MHVYLISKKTYTLL